MKTFLPEWHPQSGVILTWPHEHSDWADTLPTVVPVFIEISREIAKRQLLLLIAYDENHLEGIRAQLIGAGVNIQNIRFACLPSNDTWVRDYGPLTVHEGSRLLLNDFVFNGWGNKFEAQLDNHVTRHLYNLGLFPNCSLQTEKFVLEGGSVESDGKGTILTTTHCLFSPERNPRYGKQDIETYLSEHLGSQRVLWLEHGHLEGDDTDSHIDTLVRFCNENTITYVCCDDPDDSHFDDMKKMEQEVLALTDSKGTPYQTVPLPWPAAKFSAEDGHRLPATYANFLIINGAVLVPTYEDANDELALSQIKKCFPDREIIGINCLPIIEQHGSLHCLTMQLPEGVLA